MEESEDFAELLFAEVIKDGLDSSSSVEMLCDMAKTGDWDTVASAVGYFAEMARPDVSAELLKRVMKPSDPKTERPVYHTGAQVLGRMIDSGNLTCAKEIAKFLLVARESPPGHKVLDCFDLSFILGAMVGQDQATWPGKLLYAFYTDEGDDSATAQASQALVPFLLGTLIDNNQAAWAVEAAKQLLYTDLDLGEGCIDPDDGEGADYSVLGWCMAQMVWSGRADWAARICVELNKQRLPWFSTGHLLGAVAGWGDRSYSQTIDNFMREIAAREGRAAPVAVPR